MNEQNYTLGSYLVAFLDVLGQREKLRNLRLPERKEDEAAVIESLKGTAGIVLGLRKVFRDCFESFREGIAARNPEVAKAIRVPDLFGFSDSFVMSLPLRKEDGSQPTVLNPLDGCYCALSAACFVMITSLASGHALRGGIDVGLGMGIAPGEIYGAALEQAYFLEHSKAKYPRILIGDEMWKFLSLGLSATEKLATAEGRAMKDLIQKHIQLTYVDRDGLRALDYLGQGVFTHVGMEDSVKGAYGFVLSEQALCLSLGNDKLSERYTNLRHYFESRLPLWGMSPSPSKGS